MKVDIIKILTLSLFTGFMISSCADENDAQVNPGGLPGVHFNMTRADQDVINNTQVYMFDGQGADVGEFYKKVPGVAYSSAGVSMNVESGTWDFALVSAEEDIESNIISPVRGNLRNSAMWIATPTSDELKSMPELRMGYLAGQLVNANQNNTGGPLDLYRNVAKVRVYIEEANGLDPAGTSTMELTGVPTTINWEGKLMPNKVTPTLSTKPMKGQFVIGAHPNKTGYQQSQPIEFIIPAHRGNDFYSATPVDTTEQKLTLSIDLALMAGGRNTKNNIVISKVPRVNGILEVRLFAGGEVKVTAGILDWEDKNINTDISNTVLETDKSSVGLAYKDTVYVNTNADAFTFAKDLSASWLTVQRIGNTNAIEVIANVDTYVDNSPRDSYFTITANNVTKKIPVTQRPDRGTISVNQDRLIVSPPTPTKAVSVTSIGGSWKIITNTQKASYSITAGNEGTSSVNITRGTTLNDAIYDRVYGDTIIVVKNTRTLDTDTIKLSNLFIFVDDTEILIDHVEHADVDVDVYGGDQRSINVSTRRPQDSWIYSGPDSYYNNSTNKLHLRTVPDPQKDERWGYIVLQHKDDPTYTVELVLRQDIYVDIPEFDYFVVEFKWANSGDVDIRVGFADNPTTVNVDGTIYYTPLASEINDKWVGWSSTGTGHSMERTRTNGSKITTYYVKDPSSTNVLLDWGGDATGGQGETVFFNAPLINSAPYPGQYGIATNNPNLLPRKLTLRVFGSWYSSTYPTVPITCTIYCYKGGTMVWDGWSNFNNSGGQNVLVSPLTRTYKSSQKYYNFHVADIVYDRKKHTATVDWKVAAAQ